MSKYPSPVGNIKRFKGDLFKYKENPYGFFYVKIKAPDNNVPILQTRVKTVNSQIITIAPLGN